MLEFFFQSDFDFLRHKMVGGKVAKKEKKYIHICMISCNFLQIESYLENTSVVLVYKG